MMNDSIDLSPEALTRLKVLAQKATPGPWIDYEGSIYQENEGCFWIADVGRTIEDRQEERAYIAATHPGVILAMCEEIERLRNMRLDQMAETLASLLNAAASAATDEEVIAAKLGTECPYCGYESSSIEEAKAHDGTCPKHPAVIRAARLEKEADWLARVCAEQMLDGVDEQSVQWWREKARGAAEVSHD